MLVSQRVSLLVHKECLTPTDLELFWIFVGVQEVAL